MAAIRAGVLNQGLGNFHGAGYYRNINYQNRFDDEEAESGSESGSDDSSQDSRFRKNQSQNYAANAFSLEKHRKLAQKKNEFILKLENRLKYIDAAIILVGSFGVIIAHSESELYYKNNDQQITDSNLYRSLVTISTMILLVLVVIQARFDYDILKESREAAEDEVPSFFQSKSFLILLLELLICSIHCPPGVNKVYITGQLGGTLTISINEICASFMLLRVYLFFKVFRYFSKWTSHHAKEICTQNNAKATPFFAVKAILKDKPFHLLIPLIILSLVVFSTGTRIYERNFSTPVTSQQEDYSYIWNAMWMIMLTMTTVGYGDFFPRTHEGRFIAVMACIWGIFLISLMVVTLTNFLLFSNEESRSFHYFNRVKALENSKKFARLFVKAHLERYLYYRKSKKDREYNVYIENLNLVIKYYFKKFKEYQQQAKFADIEAAEMLTVLNERISVQVNVINRNLKYALKVHENLTIALASQNNVKYCLESSIKHLTELKKIV